jgi:outer membrane protein assembly factor BamA
MKMFTVRWILALAVFLAAVSCHPTTQTKLPNLSTGAVIDGLEVGGNQAITTEAILAKIQTKAGDKINTTVIKQDIKSLYSLGFESVRVEESTDAGGGKIIRFIVREKIPKPAS